MPAGRPKGAKNKSTILREKRQEIDAGALKAGFDSLDELRKLARIALSIVGREQRAVLRQRGDDPEMPQPVNEDKLLKYVKDAGRILEMIAPFEHAVKRAVTLTPPRADLSKLTDKELEAYVALHRRIYPDSWGADDGADRTSLQ